MKRILILIGLLCCVSSFAAERELIWPKGKMPDAQPHQFAAMTDEVSQKGFKPQKHRTAYIEWFDAPAPQKRNGGCMVLISGGAYNRCCDVGYIREWSQKLTELGFQCVNLVYRTPRPEGIAFYQTAWEDGQRAIRLVRSEAAERGLDPERIGIMGSSAGGHLTLMGVTSSLHRAYLPVDNIDREVPCALRQSASRSS